MPFLEGKGIPPSHFPSKACQHVTSCIWDDDTHEAILASIGSDLNVESFLQILSFNDWIKILPTIYKYKAEGLKFFQKQASQIPTMTKAL